MIWERMENQGEGASHMVHGIQGSHDQEQHQELDHCSKLSGHEGGELGFMFPAAHVTLPPLMHHDHHVDQGGLYPCLSTLPLPPVPYMDVYSRRPSSTALPFAYDPRDLTTGLYMSPEGLLRGGGLTSSSQYPFAGLQADFGRMTAQDIMDAKALAASRSHSEAERRRRERINTHLARLRSLLPSTTKTDKASLLAELIQHVKELKRQTSEIAEDQSHPLPTEADELTVDASSVDDEGRLLVRASVCCDDRPDLLPDLIRALKSLRLRTVKSEITTLGGRVKNVLVVTGDDDDDDKQQSIASIQDALKAVMEIRPAGYDQSASTGGGGTKRQRTNKSSSSSRRSTSSILECRSI